MFSSNQLDPIVSSEIMELVGSAYYDVNNPRKLNQIRDIVTYFKDVDNRRFQILKVLSNKSGDKLDVLWTYVALQKEKQAKTLKLNPEHFEEDVAKELAKGYLPKEKIDKVKESLAKLKAERKQKEKEEAVFNKTKDAAISEIDLDGIEETVNEIDFINKELLAYE